MRHIRVYLANLRWSITTRIREVFGVVLRNSDEGYLGDLLEEVMTFDPKYPGVVYIDPQITSTYDLAKWVIKEAPFYN